MAHARNWADGPPGRGSHFLTGSALVAILLFAFLIRFYLSLVTAYIWDEDRDWIPIADSISLDAEDPYLPLRGEVHGALPAYFIKAGAVIFGENPLGFRAASVLFGVGTVLIVFLAARVLAGAGAAVWAAILLALNEYHAMISSVAVQKVFALFFVAAATYTFALFLSRDNPRWLYPTAALSALGFLCYEIASLMLPAFAATMLLSGHKGLFMRRESHVSILIFLALISPDIIGNYLSTDVTDVSYADHLSRIGGLGFTLHHFLFFFRDAATFVYKQLGLQLLYDGRVYAAMNSMYGVILLSSAAVWTSLTIRQKEIDNNIVALFLLILFWSVLVFFVLIRPGADAGSGRAIVAVEWYWVHITLVPGVILAGGLISRLRRSAKLIAVVAAGTALGYAGINLVQISRTYNSHAVVLSPGLPGPDDRGMVALQAHFHYCYLCDDDPSISLVDVRLFDEERRRYASVLGTGAVEGAEAGTADTEFKVRAPKTPGGTVRQRRRYRAIYRITNRSGQERIRAADAVVPKRPGADSGYQGRLPFWAR